MAIDLELMGRRARAAARRLSLATTAQKNAALEALAVALPRAAGEILPANAEDLARARDAGTSASLLDRMLLNEQRLAAIAEDIRSVARLADPVGEQFDTCVLANGLRVHKRRVPFGTV